MHCTLPLLPLPPLLPLLPPAQLDRRARAGDAQREQLLQGERRVAQAQLAHRGAAAVPRKVPHEPAPAPRRALATSCRNQHDRVAELA